MKAERHRQPLRILCATTTRRLVELIAESRSFMATRWIGRLRARGAQKDAPKKGKFICSSRIGYGRGSPGSADRQSAPHGCHGKSDRLRRRAVLNIANFFGALAVESILIAGDHRQAHRRGRAIADGTVGTRNADAPNESFILGRHSGRVDAAYSSAFGASRARSGSLCDKGSRLHAARTSSSVFCTRSLRSPGRDVRLNSCSNFPPVPSGKTQITHETSYSTPWPAPAPTPHQAPNCNMRGRCCSGISAIPPRYPRDPLFFLLSLAALFRCMLTHSLLGVCTLNARCLAVNKLFLRAPSTHGVRNWRLGSRTPVLRTFGTSFYMFSR